MAHPVYPAKVREVLDYYFANQPIQQRDRTEAEVLLGYLWLRGLTVVPIEPTKDCSK